MILVTSVTALLLLSAALVLPVQEVMAQTATSDTTLTERPSFPSTPT